VRYRAKWKLALDQFLRLHKNGVHFDWLTFDEGYGSKVPFLWVLGQAGQKFVAEVPKSFSVRASADGPSIRADEYQAGTPLRGWHRYRLARKTLPDQVWRARGVRVWAARGWHRLITAVNATTGEVKYFITNAIDEPVQRVLRVAFRRATIEHAFRLAKQEAGLMHYEGRDYTGLMRHLILVLIVLGFVAVHTERLRGKKSRLDSGAGVPSLKRPLCHPAASPPPGAGDRAGEPGDPVSSAA
jgi:SRSO17 transposase